MSKSEIEQVQDEGREETENGSPQAETQDTGPERGGEGPLSFWEMLEERIIQLVRKIASLQAENAELKKELVEKEKALKEARQECKRLNNLKREMREKVERLIVKIEEYQEMAEKNELPKPPKE